MLIQMPIIMGLIRSAAAADGVHDRRRCDDCLLFTMNSFAWIADLSQPDRWILPILAGVATFIAFSMNQQQLDEADRMPLTQMAGMHENDEVHLSWS